MENLQETENNEKEMSSGKLAGILLLIGFGMVGLNGLSILIIESWYPVIFGLGVLFILGGVIVLLVHLFGRKAKN